MRIKSQYTTLHMYLFFNFPSWKTGGGAEVLWATVHIDENNYINKALVDLLSNQWCMIIQGAQMLGVQIDAWKWHKICMYDNITYMKQEQSFPKTYGGFLKCW